VKIAIAGGGGKKEKGNGGKNDIVRP